MIIQELLQVNNKVNKKKLCPQINSIRQLLQNPQYQNLMDLFLDNNSIETVKELEGSEWFHTFRVLSLRGNMLKQVSK